MTTSGLYDETEDYFAILGVQEDADANTIRKAYRRLTLVFHPDKQPAHARDVAHRLFVRLQNAYDTLSDAALKCNYSYHRRLYYWSLFGRKKGFDEWMNNTILVQLTGFELKSKYHFEAMKEKWKADASAQKKREDEHRQSEHEKRRAEGRSRHSEEEMEAIAKKLEALQEEKKAMATDFRVWEARQREARSVEVEEREVERRRMKEKHESDLANIAAKFKLKMIHLKNVELKEREAAQSRQESELRRLIGRQESESETQKNDRKRVRGEYEEWCKQIDNDILYMKTNEGSYSGQHQRVRPTFHQPVYGFTKAGVRCKVCVNAGGLCGQHKRRKR